MSASSCVGFQGSDGWAAVAMGRDLRAADRMQHGLKVVHGRPRRDVGSMARIPVIAPFGPVVGGPTSVNRIVPICFRFLMPYLTGITSRSGAPCSGVRGWPSIS